MQGQQVSHYRLTEKLGAGTYGEVWKGVHVDDPDFTVAVKLVSPHVREDPAFLSALRKECRALDRMDHPSIVRFRDLVVRDGTVAMVLELLEGEDLEAVLATAPQPVDEVVRILEKALDGLAYAHGKGVVHRDIKPGNIFRCTDGRVKLMDFGVARAADGTNATKTGTLRGTLDYMAPERFSQGGGGPVSDVYALGLVAWELLAGRRACAGVDLPQKMGWHLGVGLADVRTVRPDCPAWLAEVVATLGSKDASERPVDGVAALALLRARSGGVEASTGPVTPAPVAPGTVELSTAEVAASLPPQDGGPASASSTGPRTVVLPPEASLSQGVSPPEPAAQGSSIRASLSPQAELPASPPRTDPAQRVPNSSGVSVPSARPVPAAPEPSRPARSNLPLMVVSAIYIVWSLLNGVLVIVLHSTDEWRNIRLMVGALTCPPMVILNLAMVFLAGSIQGARERWAVRVAAVFFALWSLLQLEQSRITWDETFLAFILQGIITFVLAHTGGPKTAGE